MHVSNINTSGAAGIPDAASEGKSAKRLGKEGQIVEGVITEVSDKITIIFDDVEVKVYPSVVHNAKVGDVRKFQIVDISEKGVMLKEVPRSTPITQGNKMINTTVETDKSNIADHAPSTEEQADSGEAAKEQLEDIGNRITENDYIDLEEEGFSLDRYNLERLEKALERIKIQRDFKKENIEDQVEKKKDYRRQMEKAVISGVIKNPADKLIARKLISCNLPVTVANIEKLSNAVEMAAAAGNLSDKSIKYMIDNNLEPTVENVYHAKYAESSGRYAAFYPKSKSFKNGYLYYVSSYTKEHDPFGKDTSVWEDLEPQVEKIIENAGIKVNQTSKDEARWLFEHDLPINEESIRSLNSLQKLLLSYSSEGALDLIVNAYRKGMKPEQTLLIKSDYNPDLPVTEITSRRQLEEVRLRMTEEAGRRLKSQGVEINTGGLQKIVEGLRQMEKGYYQNLLKEADVPDTVNNMTLLKNTVERINDLKDSPSYLLGVTFTNRHKETISSLHEEASGMKVRMNKAMEAYDTLMTHPREDMGDSIEKAFESVDSILKDMNLETTHANRRAVKILGYNNMEVTNENIALMKNYDAQVNMLLKEMHPAAAVWMIKSGVNPLDTPVEVLNEKLIQMKDELGITEEEKYSKFLWKMDRDETLNEKERKAFIGIYRLLNSVEKSNGAAVGAVIHAGQEVTLNHLLSAVNTRNIKGIDTGVDDAFKKNVKASPRSETISSQIEYFSGLARDIKNEFDIPKWNQITDQEKSFDDRMNHFMNKSVESIKEALEQAEESVDLEKAYAEEKIATVRELSRDCKEAARILDYYNLPVTVENLLAANDYIVGGKSVFRELEECSHKYKISDMNKIDQAMDDISINFDNADKINEDFSKLEKGMQSILDKACEDSAITAIDLASLRRLGTGIKLAKSFAKEESYEIPLKVGGGITNINLTVIRGSKEVGKVHINIDSDQLGKIGAEFSIKENTIKGCVLCDSKDGLEVFLNEKENLKNAMEGLELNVTNLDVGMDKNYKWSYEKLESKKNGAGTKQLYQAAKVFIHTIRSAENKLSKM